jgi:hypothetical protein
MAPPGGALGALMSGPAAAPLGRENGRTQAEGLAAAPVLLQSRRAIARRYYDLISASLAKCSLLTNAALMDAIRAAQRELLRPPAEAVRRRASVMARGRAAGS